jgi:hypothetical protein
MSHEDREQFVRRQTLLVDARIQAALLLRVAVYWVICLVTMTFILFIWRIVLDGPDRLFDNLDGLPVHISACALATICLLPVVLYDVLRHSSRFVGPIVRLQKTMGEIAQGKTVEPLRFRKQDYWQDLTSAFNGNLSRLQSTANDANASAQAGRTPTVASGQRDKVDPRSTSQREPNHHERRTNGDREVFAR